MYKSTTSMTKFLYDYRSDTVTKPSVEMRKAMMNAPVGDDVYNDDPSVNKLQQICTELSGHESALFCSSGVLTNQLAIRTHLIQPPYSVICDNRAHVFKWESSGISFHTGASVNPIFTETWMTEEDIRKNFIADDDLHTAPTKLVCLENTMNGQVYPIETLRKISKCAKDLGVPLHLDGARLWNASVKTGISIKEYCSLFDSVSLCLSKGLGSPIGSILVGSKSFIKKATHFRKLYGGGWRQAGMLAAAGIYALEHVKDLEVDHQNAKYIHDRMVELGIRIVIPVETNMIWFDVSKYGTIDQLSKIGERYQIKLGGGKYVGRIVLHKNIDAHGISLFMKSIYEFVQESSVLRSTL